MHDADDETLMLAYRDGDASAFDVLYQRHRQRLFHFLVRKTGSRETGEELYQEAWLRLIRHHRDYQPSARFTTWLFTLAHHRMVDHWRTHKAHASLDAETEEGAALADTLAAASGFGPERRLDSREQAQALLDALAALPAAQREAFLLQAEAGMSVAEIAQATGVPLETARSRLRYARAQLRTALESFA